jgi:predicted DNA-binding transcriptional regulator AlpA
MLDRHEVVRRLGISLRTFDRMLRSGQFPRPVEVSPNCHRWSVATVSAWLEKKAREPRKSRVVRGIIAQRMQPKPKIVRIRLPPAMWREARAIEAAH